MSVTHNLYGNDEKLYLLIATSAQGIQDSFRITHKIESLVVFAIFDIPWKFQKDFFITFWVILLTHRQTNKLWQKH